MALSAGVTRQLLATTMSNYKRRLYDNVTGSNLILATLKAKGRITSVDGGHDIRGPVIFDEELFKWYSGMDPLPRDQKETIGEAVYKPGMAVASVTISGEERMKNAGRAQIVKLMRGKLENAENTIKTGITKGLYGDGSTPNSFVGLDGFASEDPAVGTVGGINAAGAPWWRSKTVEVDLTGVTDEADKFRKLRTGMSNLYRKCSVGTEQPDIITLDDPVFGIFEGGLQDNQRFTDAESAKMGFDTLRYRGAKVVSESDGSSHPENQGYFINTSFLNLEYYEGRLFEELDLADTTPDLDAVTKHIGFMGALTTYKRSRQGRLIVTGV